MTDMLRRISSDRPVQQAFTTITQAQWVAAVKFLMGEAKVGPFLEPAQNRTLMGLLTSGQPMTMEQAHAALKRLGWTARHGHENEFLTYASAQRDWELAIFRNATHFNVFRLHRRGAAGTMPQRESTAYHTFPEAVANAAPDVRALVYAVTADGANFCVPRGEWEKYTAIWSER